MEKSILLFILNISFKAKGNQNKLNKTNIRYFCNSVSLIFFYYIVLVVSFKEFLIISTSPLVSPFFSSLPSSIISLSFYFFNINKAFLTSKDLSTKISTFTNLIIGKKLNIQVYRQIILGVIKFFILERVDKVSLTLLDIEQKEEKEDFTSVIANQINHSLNVEELNYARNSNVFPNVKGSTQIKYLQFCFRFFKYFNILSFNLDSNLFVSALQIENRLKEENLNKFNNTFALVYSKSSSSSF